MTKKYSKNLILFLDPGRKGSGSMTVGGGSASYASHRGISNFATLGPPVERALKPKNSGSKHLKLNYHPTLS